MGVGGGELGDPGQRCTCRDPGLGGFLLKPSIPGWDFSLPTWLIAEFPGQQDPMRAPGSNSFPPSSPGSLMFTHGGSQDSSSMVLGRP